MSEQQLQALEKALALKERELAIIKSIDLIRDTSPEPKPMFAAIVKLLAEHLRADLCFLFLRDRTTGTALLRASLENGETHPELAAWTAAARSDQLLQQDEIVTWAGYQLLADDPAAPVSPELQLVVVPIIMGTDERLGAIMLGRIQLPFSSDDLQLLSTAENQIDSAIIQGMMYEENRIRDQAVRLKQSELSLLMDIDRIRDTVADPTTMHTAIVTLLADRFKADLCMLFLISIDSGEVELRALSDRSQSLGQLDQEKTRQLAQEASQLDDIAIWSGKKLLADDNPLGSNHELQLVAVPIIMGTSERLGALLMTRASGVLSADELHLLRAAEDQIDSAVIQGYAKHKQLQFTRELDTIYRIDRIRDQDLPFSDMLNAVLQEVLSTIEAEMGFVMLFDRAGKQLELRASTPSDLFQNAADYALVDQLVKESLDKGTLIHRDQIGDGIRSLMCLPLILNDQVIGVLGTINRIGMRAFTPSERRLLVAIGSQVDTAIFERREKLQLRRVLGRSVDPRVMERLLANPDVDILKGERTELSVLYADIRGSTSLAERTEPELLVEYINDYLAQMTEAILSHEGTLDKFVGDEVMALFGAPVPQADHAIRAVRVGLAMQTAHQAAMPKWRARGVEAAHIGIGIATGELIVGEMGCAHRTDYTVIGRAANLGARICSVAAGGHLLISQRTYDLVKDRVKATAVPNQNFKGVGKDVTVFHVAAVID